MSSAEVDVALSSYGTDHHTIADFILELGGPDEASQVEVGEDAQRHARNLVMVRWEHVGELLDVLLERETLDEGECRQVLESLRIV